MTRVVFLLSPELHLLDLAGPAQVFTTATDLGCDYQLSYAAEQQDVPTAQGAVLRASIDWPAVGPDDLVLVPGWRAWDQPARCCATGRTYPTSPTGCRT